MRSEPFGLARAASFEQLAGVFASCGALHYAKNLKVQCKILVVLHCRTTGRKVYLQTMATCDPAVVCVNIILAENSDISSARISDVHFSYSFRPALELEAVENKADIRYLSLF